MKKYTRKWKTLNKNGLKLSLICGLNWLIKIVFKGQFYLFSAVFCGLLTYYMPQDIQLFTVSVLELIINQNVIKPPYQEVVELSYLNREVITAIQYKSDPFKREKESTFIDDDTIYYPIFTVHPFGSLEGKSDFYHKLIKLRLSQKDAFTTIGVIDF